MISNCSSAQTVQTAQLAQTAQTSQNIILFFEMVDILLECIIWINLNFFNQEYNAWVDLKQELLECIDKKK